MEPSLFNRQPLGNVPICGASDPEQPSAFVTHLWMAQMRMIAAYAIIRVDGMPRQVKTCWGLQDRVPEFLFQILEFVFSTNVVTLGAVSDCPCYWTNQTVDRVTHNPFWIGDLKRKA